MTNTSFTFNTLPGHVEGSPASITFSFYCDGDNLVLDVSGQGPDSVFGAA